MRSSKLDNHSKYTLTALQLLAVSKVNLHRNEKSYSLFDDFVHNVNMLNGDGLELKINNEFKT